ncbi:MAG: LysM peptidoglycan-binding domain-containing protein [Verrucomicrobia bacterium]|nr:LysM peptidoglycan-binding domain-containing protein [Verrucomicrobiota bacterium]
MKILKIFGVVVAFHAAVFMFIFAIPGCRSTGKQKPATAADAGATSPLASPGGDALLAGSPVAPAEAPATVRFSPTRPGTPAAAVLEAQPVAAVQPVTSYAVAKNDSLWTIAKKHGVTVKDLAAANNLKPDVTLRLGQKLIIPGKTSAAATSASASTLTYTVKAGDSLDSIARHAGTTKAAIKSLNKLKSETVRAGQTLTLPAAGAAAPAAAPAPETVAQPARGGSMTHVIKAGETLGSIARKYQVKTGDLAAANNIADPTKIRVGQELKIPGWQAPAASKSAAPAAPASVPAFTPAPAPSPVAPAPESPLFSTPPADAASPLAAPETPVIKVEDGDTKAN